MPHSMRPAVRITEDIFEEKINAVKRRLQGLKCNSLVHLSAVLPADPYNKMNE